MHPSKLSLFIIGIFASFYNVKCITTGNCVQSLPVISDFNPNRYFGQWYTIERFDYIWEKGFACSRAKYTNLNETTFQVYNTGFKNNKPESVTGTAQVKSEPNQFLITLPVIVDGVKLFENSGDYNVWTTDYENYSLVYSCSQAIPNLVKLEKAWILARNTTLDQAFIDKLKQILKKQNVDVSQFEKVDQSCPI